MRIHAWVLMTNDEFSTVSVTILSIKNNPYILKIKVDGERNMFAGSMAPEPLLGDKYQGL